MPDLVGKDRDFIATTKKESGPDSIRVFEIFNGDDLKVIEGYVPILFGSEWPTATARQRADLTALIANNLAMEIKKKYPGLEWSELDTKTRRMVINATIQVLYRQVLEKDSKKENY